MSLPGKVQSAAPGLLGFDANTVISSATAQKFVGDGYKFCVRYLSRSTPEPKGDLTSGEANDILAAGLALMAVQHVAPAGWTPSAALGTSNGVNAAANAKSVGFPSSVNVWLDLEGVNNAASSADVIAYCNAWYAAVQSAGYVPGIYVGSESLLTSQQLYSSLSFQHYWRSQSNVPNVESRGYQLIQLYPSLTVNGVDIDVDVTQNDYKNGQVLWLAK